MAELIDELARAVAAGRPRREVLKQLGGGLAALLFAALLPEAAEAGGASAAVRRAPTGSG